jgi:hypothetical protein
MRRHLGTVLVGLIISVALAAFAQQPPQASGKLKSVVDHMKQFAASHPGLVSRMPQGTSYFKWIQNPPPGYEKAFFQLIELNIGKRFLSLKLVRKTAAGVELTVLTDNDLSGSVDEAYRATGRTLADADRAIQTSQDKLKTAVTSELAAKWTEGLDELKWELKAD